ncbi:MAG: 23S rRNA (pseudouridine(1915)-N(3))-methyltransferase RlmH [Burkholderiales bacterium]|nr:23S rRNA (pseudouridine(1915)-N(3))-methyltransferase RlmH [Burkholderiales bacterium]
MKINIINVANKMPNWVTVACGEYLSRINHGKYSCKIIEIKSERQNNKPILENMAIEAHKIKAQVPDNSYIIALDENGKNFNSIKFADELEKISLNNANITFIIGGADGIHPALKQQANLQIQLSALTFPHALVRIIILEQIYRALSILENHPYHRE